MEKIKVNQDTLYQYMTDHDVKLVRLAELIGKSADVVTACFKHQKDMNGNPRSFSSRNIALINKALPQLAAELRSCILSFGSEHSYVSSRGVAYDPGLVEPVKRIGNYLNITAVVERLLGWTKSKKAAVLVFSKKAYGHIAKEDADRINAELLSIAAVLESYEVVADGK